MLQIPLESLEVQLALGLRADAQHLDHTEATARVLLALEAGAAVPMGVMAQRLGRDPSTATRFVDRAVAQGLVRREAGHRDRRRRLALLTSEGALAREALVARRLQRAQAVLDEVQQETGLGPGQIEWFLDAFAKGLRAAVNLEEPSAPT